uniref:NADH-ubiquinone oxidoreductase chain 4L n=1 Tax=Thremma gallicum TaxID=1586284 RepID=A0A0U1ZBT1_9NEOP|nr:NADH dehydrogenase subunit 4L [Thremma gallicum]
MKIFQVSNLISFSYLIGNLMFSLNRKHLLIVLLSLELIMLNLFFLMNNYLVYNMSNSVYFLVMFMILTVCEGVLGLSILVYMIRIYGSDYIYMNSIL